MGYLVKTKNDIAFDDLDGEDLKIVENADDYDCFEILDGDESTQRTLGEKWKLSDLKSFEAGDRLVSSYVDPTEIPFPFRRKKGYFGNEFIYECIREQTPRS